MDCWAAWRRTGRESWGGGRGECEAEEGSGIILGEYWPTSAYLPDMGAYVMSARGRESLPCGRAVSLAGMYN